MVYPCSKCGASARPVKKGDRFSVRCCNENCKNAIPFDKTFYTLEFAYSWWNRMQSIEKEEKGERKNEGIERTI